MKLPLHCPSVHSTKQEVCCVRVCFGVLIDAFCVFFTQVFLEALNWTDVSFAAFVGVH